MNDGRNLRNDAEGQITTWKDELAVVRAAMVDALTEIEPQDGGNDAPLGMLWGTYTIISRIAGEMDEATKNLSARDS